MHIIRIIFTILVSFYCSLGLFQGLGFLVEAIQFNAVLPVVEALIEIPGNVLILPLSLMGMWPRLRPEAWK